MKKPVKFMLPDPFLKALVRFEVESGITRHALVERLLQAELTTYLLDVKAVPDSYEYYVVPKTFADWVSEKLTENTTIYKGPALEWLKKDLPEFWEVTPHRFARLIELFAEDKGLTLKAGRDSKGRWMILANKAFKIQTQKMPKKEDITQDRFIEWAKYNLSPSGRHYVYTVQDNFVEYLKTNYNKVTQRRLRGWIDAYAKTFNYICRWEKKMSFILLLNI